MASWYDIPGMPGYQIRTDWQQVRSVTRKIWKLKGCNLEDREEVGYIKECSILYQEALLRSCVVKGKVLTPTMRGEDKYFRMYGSAFSIPRIRKAVKSPLTAPLKPRYLPFKVEVFG